MNTFFLRLKVFLFSVPSAVNGRQVLHRLAAWTGLVIMPGNISHIHNSY
jgi:hypothetical protein